MAGNALLDLLQGASNAAASNVSGPVDLLAWALRKAGVPVPEDAVLSSKWMADRGLTREPTNKLAGLAGETLGMISPIAAGAYAPQIAKGAIKGQKAVADALYGVGEKASNMAGDYLVATGQIAPATVWHGSPHKFDKFDASKIGTGEGAQAYGHGLYLADAPDVARAYQNALSKYGELRFADGTVENIQDLPYNSARQIAGQIWMSKPNFQDAKFALGNLDPKYLGQPKEAVLKELESLRDANASLSGNFYKVDLPDSAIARMLDWDKPLSQQAPEVQAAVRPMLADAIEAKPYGGGWGDFEPDPSAVRDVYTKGGVKLGLYSQNDVDNLNLPGSLIVKAFGDGDKSASIAAKALQAKGIPGIRYLDGGSRGAGAGTSNYVVFPGEENMLTILERNGVPLNALQEAARGR